MSGEAVSACPHALDRFHPQMRWNRRPGSFFRRAAAGPGTGLLDLGTGAEATGATNGHSSDQPVNQLLRRTRTDD